MILTAHQPVYLPWCGLIHKISLADEFVCYDHVQHSSKDYTNKNSIKTSHGKLNLIVPIKHAKNSRVLLSELCIDQESNWKRTHWLSIKNAYSKTKYFREHAMFFENFYNTPWKSICKMNTNLLSYLLEALGIPRNIKFSTNLNVKNTKSEGVLETCKIMNADMIIFGALGKNYVDRNIFHKENIKIYFQSYNHPKYTQIFGKFISHLSVIDLLFNYGKNSLDIIMDENIKKSDLLKMLK